MSREPRLSSEERDLGLDVSITRRDFLDAALLAAGAALLRAPAPLWAQQGGGPRTNPEWEGFGGVGDYARSHGNTWDALSVAHDMRDGKLRRAREEATDTGETYDLIVVGGGLSGLGAAAFFQMGRGGKALVLDNHRIMGGEAKRNEFDVDGQKLIGPQGSNNFGTRVQQGWAGDYWKALGIPAGDGAYEFVSWSPGVQPIEIARDNYNFQLWQDEFASHGFFFKEANGSLRLVRDAFRGGLRETPWTEQQRADFLKWRSNPKVFDGEGEALARWLDGMTYEELITRELKLDPIVARYADPILAAAAGGLGSDVISAQCAGQVRLPGTVNGRSMSRKLEDSLPYSASFPGGNDGIMRHVVKKLVPSAIDGEGFAGILNGRMRFEELDKAGHPTRIRLGATAIRVTNLPNGNVEVVYSVGGKLHKTTAKSVVMANGAWSSQYIVADVGQQYREAFNDFVRAPMMVVNVALRRWRPLYEMGITAASYRDLIGFSCNIRQSMVVGDYRPALHPDKPAVLTFYVSFERPGGKGGTIREQSAAARTDLLGTTYRDYERKVREQLVRLFGPGGFDPRNDVAGIILNRWGHAFVCPAPGFYFGRNGKPAAPDVLREPVGRVAFANSELHGHQNWRDATAEGKRAVEQLWSSVGATGG
jgi:spermidine dehydrogenase